jgi:hypothetical protein
MAAGYSGTPLVRKLGIEKGDVVALVNEPPTFRTDLDPIPDLVTFRTSLRGSPDVAVMFFTRRRELENRLPLAARAIFPDGAVWVAWHKKSSKVPTDITEDTVREVALPMGLVDNKVAAIDDVWSGLRVVWRKENRGR